jgi:GTP-binding protein
MYNVKSAEFTRGIVGTNEILLGEKPQVAFVGRSNVGKSTLINSLVGKKDLARSSSNPGRTQEINFFLVNENIYFVDLPGYGFAKISKKRRETQRLGC